MGLYTQIQDEIKACMKSGNKEKLSVLRMVLSEIKYEQAKVDMSKDLDDKACLKVMQSYHKKLVKSAAEYPDGEHKNAILSEVKILEPYLPKKAGEAETKKIVEKVIGENPEEKNFGVLMKKVLGELGQAADGKLVSQLLKQSLS